MRFVPDETKVIPDRSKKLNLAIFFRNRSRRIPEIEYNNVKKRDVLKFESKTYLKKLQMKKKRQKWYSLE